jgi:hypothetical protein
MIYFKEEQCQNTESSFFISGVFLFLKEEFFWIDINIRSLKYWDRGLIDFDEKLDAQALQRYL